MNIKEFKYTKNDGSVSNRVVVVLSDPKSHVYGIDMTELSPEQQVSFAQEMKQLNSDYIEAMEFLRVQYDLKYNLRQFDPKKMSDITEEVICLSEAA